MVPSGCMWALALMLAAAPVQIEARPDGAVDRPVAQVLLSSGDVKVLAKATFPAKSGQQLGEADAVQLKDGAWVVLYLLENDQVVRLDDELTLPMSKVAMRRAGPAKGEWKARLEAMLSPAERKEKADRLTGWHAAPMAANVPTAPPATSSAQPMPPPPPAPSPGAVVKSTRPTPPVDEGTPRPQRRGLEAQTTRGPGGNETEAREKELNLDDEGSAGKKRDNLKPVVNAEDEAGLRCADELLSSLGGGLRASTTSLEFDVREVSPGTFAVRELSGVPVNDCLRQWVLRKPHGTKAWKITLPLPAPTK